MFVMSKENIRNFSIVAHIDHGKSTLADRLLEYTGALSKREMVEQVLDDMDLERERGITIKAHAVRLTYTAKDGKEYILNLIDTPGHVDFTYEVSRSLAACEGAVLVVDAVQGVEAQTLANAYLAIDNDLEIVPVINKIDLPSADPEKVKEEIEKIIGIDASEAILTSAKEGIGTEDVLEAIVNKIPAPKGDINKPFKALIFDSWYDNYRGVVILVKVVDGKITPNMKMMMMSSNIIYEVNEIGIFNPKMNKTQELSAGEVGYVVAAIKKVTDTKIGDTITEADRQTDSAFPGFKEVKPMVFCGLYTINTEQYEDLRDALEKLRLNDSSFSYEPETSLALGFGFRCGFLGLLHMEIIRERLEREFNLSLISTAPTVVYQITTSKNERLTIDNPVKMPEAQYIERFEEPFILANIILPDEYVGSVMQLCQDRRGIQKEFTYLGKDRVLLKYELPLNEIVLDFYDKLKSLTKGYA